MYNIVQQNTGKFVKFYWFDYTIVDNMRAATIFNTKDEAIAKIYSKLNPEWYDVRSLELGEN